MFGCEPQSDLKSQGRGRVGHPPRSQRGSPIRNPPPKKGANPQEALEKTPAKYHGYVHVRSVRATPTHPCPLFRQNHPRFRRAGF